VVPEALEGRSLSPVEGWSLRLSKGRVKSQQKNGKEAIVKGLSGVPRDPIDVKQAAPWRARQMFAEKSR